MAHDLAVGVGDAVGPGCQESMQVWFLRDVFCV